MSDIVPAIVLAVVATITVIVGVPYFVSSVTKWKLPSKTGEGRRVLIWGGGSLGQQVAIDLVIPKEQRESWHLVGFLDDSETKRGKVIRPQVLLDDGRTEKLRLRVWGSVERFVDGTLQARLAPSAVIVALQNPDPEKKRRLKGFCESNHISYYDRGSHICPKLEPEQETFAKGGQLLKSRVH